MTTVSASDVMGVVSSGYEPTVSIVRDVSYTAPHHAPPFSLSVVRDMLKDPRIEFGLGLIKGPIHAFTKFFTEEESKNPAVHQWIVASETSFPYVIKSENKEVAEFVSSTLKRFWQVGCIKALKALDWGYSASEVIYKAVKSDGREKAKVVFDNLIDFDPIDCTAVTISDGLVGCSVKRGGLNEFYIGIPKVFWHTHQRDRRKYYGQSRLKGVYPAWWEIWTEGGARDIRRQWYYRNAYDGGNMRYPVGETRLPNGRVISNRNIALEIMSQRRSGGFTVMPNQLDSSGNQQWEYEPPGSSVAPQGMAEYLVSLTNEELEGMGIPPEVIQGDGGGLGAATGRKIPMVAYYSSLQQIVDFLIQDFINQVLNFLIQINFNTLVPFEVVPLIPIGAYANGADKAPTPKTEKTSTNPTTEE